MEFTDGMMRMRQDRLVTNAEETVKEDEHVMIGKPQLYYKPATYGFQICHSGC